MASGVSSISTLTPVAASSAISKSAVTWTTALAFSISFEADYPYVLQILAGAGVPLLAAAYVWALRRRRPENDRADARGLLHRIGCAAQRADDQIIAANETHLSARD